MITCARVYKIISQGNPISELGITLRLDSPFYYYLWNTSEIKNLIKTRPTYSGKRVCYLLMPIFTLLSNCPWHWAMALILFFSKQYWSTLLASTKLVTTSLQTMLLSHKLFPSLSSNLTFTHTKVDNKKLK